MDQPMDISLYGSLGIIALESFQKTGKEINRHIMERRGLSSNQKGFLIKSNEIRFSNGEGKVILDETVRGKDIFILADVGNYGCTYPMYGSINRMGPDEHFADIKRAVSALGGKARRVTVIMPLLYASRQHRRKGRESMDCAMALQELERLEVDGIYSFDVHDPNVQNAVPLMSFENLYPTREIVRTFMKTEEKLEIHKDHMVCISPDTGAMDRAIYYSTVMGLDVGMFYKRRDYSKIVNGKNPIVQHEYIGRDVDGLDVLIVDDMIASGESIFDIAKELKSRKARRIFAAVTFALFTEGIAKFDEYYEAGLLDRVYATNLTYIPEEYKNRPWFAEVNMSRFLSQIINYINLDKSISPLIDATYTIKQLMDEK